MKFLPRRHQAVVLTFLLLFGSSFATSAAAGLEKCTKKGETSKRNGVTFVCTLNSKKLVWKPIQALKKTASPSSNNSGSKTKVPNIVLVANPVDLSNVVRISKFRSCIGHDFSNGFTASKGSPAGLAPLEHARSMKHYIYTDVALTDVGSIKGFAPFDGIVQIVAEQFPLGVQMIIKSESGWTFRLFHGDPLVKDGARVKAGSPVITWPPKNALSLLGPQGQTTSSFDFSLEYPAGNIFESMFNRMDPKVAALWAAKGFSAENSIQSKAFRDANPCTVGSDGESFDHTVAENSDDFVSAKP